MPYAIVIVGHERRFMGAARPLISHLRKQAKCGRVSVIVSAPLLPEELILRLRRAMRAVPKDDVLLVAYFGHGNEGSWGYALEDQSKYISLDYKTLAKTLALHPGPLAILNDCCHAEALAPYLEKAGIAQDRCMLISACSAEVATVPGTGAEVLSSWSRGEVFETIVDRETVHFVDMTPYVPPRRVLIARWFKNAMIRLRNVFRFRKPSIPTYIFVNSPPNGWAKHRVDVIERIIGLRRGIELDHHFFPKP